MQGKIHSIESMGLVDGPGIRTVVFLQGCGLRCRYCHNPDTWETEASGAQLLQPRELVDKLRRFRPYYGRQGGVTFSGGEPLLQPEFLAQALALCREEGIHTCLDTAGCGLGDYDAILAHTDLVLLDIKHPTDAGFHQVTGSRTREWRHFLEEVQRRGIPLWLRHVVVPGLTDDAAHFQALVELVARTKGVERVELLPYHTLGVPKYRRLGLSYSLEGVPPMEKEALLDWQRQLDELVKQKEQGGASHGTAAERLERL